jgi:hypothetical protein
MKEFCAHPQWTTSKIPDGSIVHLCVICRYMWGDGVTKTMKNGEIRKLPKANSPMWTEQWAYQGTAKAPYIVSVKKKAGNGVTSGWDQTWACSCPDWTKHNPRVDCKHVLAIKLKEKIQVNPADLMSGNMNPETKKEFESFLAQKQASVVRSGKSALEEKGRKFRTE